MNNKSETLTIDVNVFPKTPSIVQAIIGALDGLNELATISTIKKHLDNIESVKLLYIRYGVLILTKFMPEFNPRLYNFRFQLGDATITNNDADLNHIERLIKIHEKVQPIMNDENIEVLRLWIRSDRNYRKIIINPAIEVLAKEKSKGNGELILKL